jgi:hypothetical protein
VIADAYLLTQRLALLFDQKEIKERGAFCVCAQWRLDKSDEGRGL